MKRIFTILSTILIFASIGHAQTEKAKKDFRFKGQDKSLIPWGKLDPNAFLDFNIWENEFRRKDANKNWSTYVHDKAQNEKVGMFIKCIGVCKLYRGLNYVNGQYRSSIIEGDVVHTEKNSYAWLLMLDGSIVRLSSHTSVSFNEVNLGKRKVFLYVRLSEGHIYWRSYDNKQLPFTKMAETDSIFLPLMIPEANVQTHERDYYRVYSDNKELITNARLDKHFYNKLQYNALNEMLKTLSKDKLRRRKTNVLLSSPTSTFFMTNPTFHYVYVLGGNGYFHSDAPEKSYQMYLRDFITKKKIPSVKDKWLAISPYGKKYQEIEKPDRILKMMELSVKRIPSIIMAREILFKSFYPLFKDIDQEKLAGDFGYRLWKVSDMRRHRKFLQNYTQEAELSSLRSLRKLLAGKPITLDGVPTRELQDVYNDLAIKKYYASLTSDAGTKHSYVKHYTKPEYYLWLLHYARKNDKISLGSGKQKP